MRYYEILVYQYVYYMLTAEHCMNNLACNA
jgi:hypothetical protein